MTRWRTVGSYLPTLASKTGLIEETRQFLLAYARLCDVEATRQALINGGLAQRSRATRVTILNIVQARLTRWHPPAWVLEDLMAFAQDGHQAELQAALLLHTARQDRLLYDIVQQVVAPYWLSNAHLALGYYCFGNVPGVATGNCQTLTCLLFVGFIDSKDGGQSWSKAEPLAGPMSLRWLALTTQGYMTGDYISTSIIPGNNTVAFPAFEIAVPPTTPPAATSGTCVTPGVVCNESTFTTAEVLLKTGDPTTVAGNASASFPAAGPTPTSFKPVTAF